MPFSCAHHRRHHEQRGKAGVTESGIVHPNLAEVDSGLFDAVRDEDVFVIGGFHARPHADTPTFPLTTPQSFLAEAPSSPALLGLRTFGCPLMLPGPLGPT